MAEGMDGPVPVTVMVFTLDEELNLPRCLESLRFTDDVLVIDSFSRDRTEAIARAAGARFCQHVFEGFGRQRNWAIANAAPRYEWILILDADERVPPELALELRRLLAGVPAGIGAYRLRRRFYLWGRWLRYSSNYPTWVVRLVHRDRVRYVNRGHAETQEVDGAIGEVDCDLIDENAKGLDEWFERQNRYATQEAEFELAQEALPLDLRKMLSPDPIVRRAVLKRVTRRLPGRALVYFVYSYFLRGGFRDGLDGLMFCSMRAMFEQMVVIKKYDMRKQGS